MQMNGHTKVLVSCIHILKFFGDSSCTIQIFVQSESPQRKNVFLLNTIHTICNQFALSICQFMSVIGYLRDDPELLNTEEISTTVQWGFKLRSSLFNTFIHDIKFQISCLKIRKCTKSPHISSRRGDGALKCLQDLAGIGCCSIRKTVCVFFVLR